ncbi:MAG TPA: TolC family protein [Candidatus Kapabacteria bacterium]|jgi:outer membrane protein|nr:TolC family protein [Candidatus Kapabacteria bacterium]HOV91552.1 TolC family protein [Candidatus Kapabacteria bacterium]
MKKSIIFLLTFLSIWSYSISQKFDTQTYTLDECLKTAIQNNYDLIVYKSALKAASSNKTSAFGSYLPSVQFTGGYSRTLNQQGGRTVNVGGQIIPIGTPSPNSYSMGLNAGLNLFDGLYREANFRAVNYNYNAADLNLQQGIVNVKIDVYRKFFDYATKKEIVEMRRENFEQGKKELESIQAQNQAGVIPISTVYSKEADLGNLELDLAKAENDLNLSRANLLSTMGLDPTMNVDFSIAEIKTDISQFDIDEFRGRIGNFERMLQEALNMRYDYQSSENFMKSAQERINMSRSSYFPSLQLGGGWSWSNSEFNQFDTYGRSYFGLNLSIPLFDGFSTNSNIEQSQYSLKQAEVQRLKLNQTIKTQVEQALLNLDASEKQIQIAQKAFKAADLNYKVLKSRFDVGSANITELIQANTQYLTSKINQITSVFGYLLAQKELEYAIGRLN